MTANIGGFVFEREPWTHLRKFVCRILGFVVRSGARSPTGEQGKQICHIYVSVSIDIRSTDSATRPPGGQQTQQIGDVCVAVRGANRFDVGRAGRFAGEAYASGPNPTRRATRGDAFFGGEIKATQITETTGFGKTQRSSACRPCALWRSAKTDAVCRGSENADSRCEAARLGGG